MSTKLVQYYPDSATVKAAQNALQVQDACNGIAVIKSLERDVSAMRENAEYIVYDPSTGHSEVFNLDTDTTNQHPVVIMYLDKLCSLARTQSLEYSKRFSDAMDACNSLANGQATQWEIL